MKIKLVRKIKSLAAFFVLALWTARLAAEDTCANGGPGCEVPEIPAGSAPFLLLGLLGSILWVRNFFSKK